MDTKPRPLDWKLVAALVGVTNIVTAILLFEKSPVDIILPALAVTFAACCVWLAVRIVNRRERWAKWTLAFTLAAMVGYPLSIYPLEWLWGRGMLPNLRWVDQARSAYRAPIVWVADNGPEWFEYALDWLETTAVTQE